MARPLWSGSISFGLVQIPVGLTPAVASTESLSFTLLDKADNAPIGYKQVNKVTGEEVPKERRVKGYEVAKNEYVLIQDDDFKRANVKATETIDIHSFVDIASIPLLRFEKPYFLVPQKKGLKAYALLQKALADTGKVAIATMVMRQRQALCAVIARDGGLLLEMLHYDHELIEPDAVDMPTVTPAQLKMAVMPIEGMSEKTFDTTSLKDTYRDDLLALIEERRNHPERAPASSDKGPKKSKAAPTDIMELLKASVAKHQAPNSAPNQGPHRGKNGANSNDEIADDEKKAGESDGAQKKRRAAHRRPARRSIRPERKQE